MAGLLAGGWRILYSSGESSEIRVQAVPFGGFAESNSQDVVMKHTNAGLSILAGGLAFVGSARATDLIVNGSFEDGPGGGWVGDFGTYNYSAAYFAGPPIPASENPGEVYSWRHGLSGTDFSGPLTQVVDLTSAISIEEIDGGRGAY